MLLTRMAEQKELWRLALLRLFLDNDCDEVDGLCNTWLEAVLPACGLTSKIRSRREWS